MEELCFTETCFIVNYRTADNKKKTFIRGGITAEEVLDDFLSWVKRNHVLLKPRSRVEVWGGDEGCFEYAV